MNTTTEQHFAISEEVLTSIRLVQSGLRELQRIDGANDFYYLPMILLSSGLERFMKVIICFHHYNNEGSFPKREIFKPGRKGHDLELLLNTITIKCYSDEYLSNIPAAKTDIEYLRNDPILQKIVNILSQFGQSARYYNLDVVLGENVAFGDSTQMWEKLELELLQEEPDWDERLKNGKLNESYKLITQKLVIQIERLMRALSHLFTIGGLGEEAGRQTGIIGPFLFLKDSDLGVTRY